MLAMTEFPPELRDLIVRKAEGNPFFLEEVLKSLLEVGALGQRDGQYVLTKPISEIYVPNTIQDVIMARIDRLEEVPKRALQLAAVIRREVAVRLLERISDVHAHLERFLQDMKVLQLLSHRRFYPELAYMFKHALTHAVPIIACSCNAARSCIGWSRWPLRTCTPNASRNPMRCSPIITSAERCGRRRRSIWSKPVKRRSRPMRIRKRSITTTGRWT